MQLTIDKILQVIREYASDKNFINKHKRQETDFIRNRKLGFEDIVYFVIGNLGTSMDFEVLNFCSEHKSNVSVAAVSKARDKVKHSAFEELLRLSAKEIPAQFTYKGYRLTAFDGIAGELPKTSELMSSCWLTERNKYPIFHAVAEYDVLNCCYTNAVFNVGAADERKAAIELLKAHKYEKDEIFLLDRGFPSLKLIQELENSGKNYIMRATKSFLREVNAFCISKNTDEIVEVKRNGYDAIINLRCVKIELGNDEPEILVTNLSKTVFSKKEIGELYNLRWKIETGFLNLKYAVRLEDFMGIKENSIKQEFFASLIKSNIYMLFIGIANEILYNKKNYKTKL